MTLNDTLISSLVMQLKYKMPVFVNEIIELHYIHQSDFFPSNAKTNAVLAALTTVHARLKLYSVFKELGRNFLYFDTGI